MESNRLYHGVFLNGNLAGGSKNGITSELVDKYEAAVRKAAWIGFPHNLYNKEFPFDTVQWITERESIPFIRLMLRDENNSLPETEFTLKKVNAGKYDNNFREWGRSARFFGFPLIVEWGKEINGQWAAWNTKWKVEQEDASDFREAFRRIVHLIRDQEKASNITWIFHANNDPEKSGNEIKSYYPGDEFVDWLGVSIPPPAQPEQTEPNKTLSDRTKFYNHLNETACSKPIFLLDIGHDFNLSNNPQYNVSKWTEQTLAEILDGKNMPRLRGFSIWHEFRGTDANPPTNIDLMNQTNSRLKEVFKRLSRSSKIIPPHTDKSLVLHKVLLNEYETLGLLTPKEVREIRDIRIRTIKEFDLKTEEEIEIATKDEININTGEKKRDEERRKQFLARNKFRYKMLEILRRKIHAKPDDEKPSALCLSGGGIRSATFCLGVLQGLAKNGLLNKFDYLSTVSGGGYIGSWFSAWLYREGNMDKVQSSLSRNRDYPYLVGLEDFKIDFNADLCDMTKEDLDNLRTTLKDEKNATEKKIDKDEFFDKKKLAELASLVPKIPSTNQKPATTSKLRNIGQDLCQQLNEIIHSEKAESIALKLEVEKRLKHDSSQNRKKIKRQIIDEQFAEIIYPLNDFEHVEPPEITYLRTYSNFMSPRTGLFSTDTWTIAAIYMRNLLLNWTVFLPLLAMILLFPKLFPAVLRILPSSFPPYLFCFSIIAGIIAVTNIILMRPSLSQFSWIKQKYEIDDEGSIISTEKKVWRLCLIPIIIVSFVITACWILSEPTSNRELVSSSFPLGLTDREKWIGFVFFYETLFLGGFIIAHSILFFLPSGGKKNRVSRKDNIYVEFWRLVVEFLASIVSAAIGGTALYLFARILPLVAENIVRWISSFKAIFPQHNEIEALMTIVYVCFGPSLFLVTVLLTTAFFFGFAGRIYSDMDREWLSRFGALILLVILGWSVLSCLVLIGPEIFKVSNIRILLGLVPKGRGENIPISLIIAIISGLITLMIGFSGKSPANEDKEKKSLLSVVWKYAPQIAAPIFALTLIILISNGTRLLMEMHKPDSPNTTAAPLYLTDFVFNSELGYLMFWIIILAIIWIIMGRCININKFSLHAMYRERLIRAYLGASRTHDRLKTVNSFTDLDDKDNVEMYKLGVQKPFHVVNMTLNLGEANNLRWQDRKAASFTATPLHCGSSNMGDGSGYYRSSNKYGYSRSNNQAITLGTVAAISGAAVSPNMGYYSMSSAVSFLMALFNVRLGWWLGNPGKRGDKTYKESAPWFSPGLLWDEATGDTTDTNKYVYLSDGGHFDNLGLYEMVLRRCHIIIACDAGADSKFGFFDLGTAVHKIRVDMGIPIEFKAGAPEKGRNCAIAEIKYSAVDGEHAKDGFLIYIKPTLDGDEPIDVVNYKNINPDFPHETTTDEFYSETQFESYRSLGFHMINSICSGEGKAVCTGVSKFKENANQYLKKKRQASEYKNISLLPEQQKT